jgi:hypothetical protein
MTSSHPKYPDVEVQLTGDDGNAFMILAKVQKALRRAGAPPDEVKAFVAEAMSDDYDNLLRTCTRWVEVS